MNITLSQWLQIAAIAISATISISRWVWDARKDKKTIADIQKMSDANEPKVRTLTPISNRLAFFLPLIVLFWQMLSPGEVTRFELGVMILASTTFLGFIILGLRGSFSILMDSNYYTAKLYHILLVSQTEHTSFLLEALKNSNESLEILRRNSRAEQGVGGQPAISDSVS
jgi:hypothetical protein